MKTSIPTYHFPVKETTPPEVVKLRNHGSVYVPEPFLDTLRRDGVESINTLFSIMAIARSYATQESVQFCEDLQAAIFDMSDLSDEIYTDVAGNVIARIGTSDILWSCHTDTIHPKATGSAPLVYDAVNVCSQYARQLGADDAVGIWVMLNMIKNRVSGLYIFHAGEECGGIGSSFIASKTPELLKGINFAIAFDRKGTGSIITHQAGGKCCSNEFAVALADALCLGHKPDDSGLFTDTANYIYNIPECTNVSAGYYNEHKFTEFLNWRYAVSLRDAVISANIAGMFDSLPVGRQCDDYSAAWEDYANYDIDSINTYAKVINGSFDDLQTLVERDPETATAILIDLGVDCAYFNKYWQ
jgi:hypothetical protein